MNQSTRNTFSLVIGYWSVERSEISSEIKATVWKFTNVGTELLPLVSPHEDDAYLERLGLFFVKKKDKAFIAQTTVRHANGQVEYQIVREVVEPEPPPQDGK